MSFHFTYCTLEAIAIRLEAIAIRVDRVEAIAIRVEAISCQFFSNSFTSALGQVEEQALLCSRQISHLTASAYNSSVKLHDASCVIYSQQLRSVCN